MKKLLFLSISCLQFISVLSQEPLYDASIFTNSRMNGNYFYSKATWQSPSWIRNLKGKLPVNESVFFTPGNSLHLQFVNGENGKWSATIFRQQIRGQDNVKDGKWLSFRFLISSANTKEENLPMVQIGAEDSSVSETLSIKNYIQSNTKNKWQQVLIPLSDFKNFKGKNSTAIHSVHFLQNGQDKNEHEIFIDDIHDVNC